MLHYNLRLYDYSYFDVLVGCMISLLMKFYGDNEIVDSNKCVK